MFDQFTLGEIQLLLLGLWVIGEQDRVDKRLLPDYVALVEKLQSAGDRQVSLERSLMDAARQHGAPTKQQSTGDGA